MNETDWSREYTYFKATLVCFAFISRIKNPKRCLGLSRLHFCNAGITTALSSNITAKG